MGLDELPVHMARKAELARVATLATAGDASALHATIMANGARQVRLLRTFLVSTPVVHTWQLRQCHVCTWLAT